MISLKFNIENYFVLGSCLCKRNAKYQNPNISFQDGEKWKKKGLECQENWRRFFLMKAIEEMEIWLNNNIEQSYSLQVSMRTVSNQVKLQNIFAWISFLGWKKLLSCFHFLHWHHCVIIWLICRKSNISL